MHVWILECCGSARFVLALSWSQAMSSMYPTMSGRLHRGVGLEEIRSSACCPSARLQASRPVKIGHDLCSCQEQLCGHAICIFIAVEDLLRDFALQYFSIQADNGSQGTACVQVAPEDGKAGVLSIDAALAGVAGAIAPFVGTSLYGTLGYGVFSGGGGLLIMLMLLLIHTGELAC